MWYTLPGMAVSAILSFLVAWGVGSTLRAQSFDEPVDKLVRGSNVSTPGITPNIRGVGLHPDSSASTSSGMTDPHFGRALLGSTIGAAIGTGTGLVLLETASNAEPSTSRHDRRNNPEEDAAGAAFMVGLACIVAGGPVGAVEMGRMKRYRRDAYVGGVVGEFVGGVLGYVLVNHFGGNRRGKLVGMGMGVILGSATGAVLIAEQNVNTGLVHYDSERWHISTPRVQAHLPVHSASSSAVGITLMSVQL